MTVTAARKGKQFRLGFPLGTTAAVIEFWPALNHLTITPTGAVTIEILASDGTVKLVSEDMTGTSPGVTVLDISTIATWPVGDYHVKHTFVSGGNTHKPGIRLMGIYDSVPEPMVTDEDLLEVIFDLNAYKGDRDNWSFEIGEAWNKLLLQLSRIRLEDGTELDPYTIADGTDLYDMHMMRSVMLVCQALRTSAGDRFGLWYNDYKEAYDLTFEAFSASQISKWAEGPVVEDVVIESNLIRSHVKKYSITRSDVANRTNDSKPPVTMQTEW